MSSSFCPAAVTSIIRAGVLAVSRKAVTICIGVAIGYFAFNSAAAPPASAAL